MDKSALMAHTPVAPGGKWHTLEEHSRDVAAAAGRFADRFQAGELAWLLGLAHDAGKADPRFQSYLLEAHLGRRGATCPHAFAGAVAAVDRLKTYALAVAGHHAGLYDKSAWKEIVPRADQATVDCAKRFLAEHLPDSRAEYSVPTRFQADHLAREMFIRMLFSCLVDADRLDTEAHRLAGNPSRRSGYPDIAWYLARLNERLAQFEGGTGQVNEVRQHVLDACRNAANAPSGVFTLTVPTGGGKTLSSLAFALNHAARHEKRRVVVAIPYTSIIDQTASVYEAMFDSNILEHHSAVDAEENENDNSDAEIRRRLASENWDCPLVVTTTVQLFESLLSNRPAKCRKLHNLVDSVLIIDEVQALPEKCLEPILDVLLELTQNFGVTVVLSTATPPDYSEVDSRLLQGAQEIVPDCERHFKSLRRVRFEFPQEDWDFERLRGELERNDQALVVLNTRRDAIAVAKAAHGLDGLAHLSTLLCGHHRKAVLAEVRRRLQCGLPVRLVSTQVVEAGVDLDFPRVYRVLGPLDRVVQAAGRCNREGKLDELGICTIFRLRGAGSPRGPYATGSALTGPILGDFGQGIAEPAATRKYTKDLYKRVSTDHPNSPVQALRKELKFKTVAETFKMIEQDTVPVVVESYPRAEVAEIIESWSAKPVGWFRRVSPYTVSIYRRDQERLQREGSLHPHESGAWIYSGPYDPVLGLGAETPDPADLST